MLKPGWLPGFNVLYMSSPDFLKSEDIALTGVGRRINPNDNLTIGKLSSGFSLPLSTATRIVDYLVEHY